MKFLVGLAKATVKIDQLDIKATPESWVITPNGAEAYLSAKGLITPTKGETGNYAESDYVRDAYGNPTSQLKPGAENLCRMTILTSMTTISDLQDSVWLSTLVPLTNGMMTGLSQHLCLIWDLSIGTIQSKLR